MLTHALAGAELAIGRDPGCDVVIDDRALSRRHAILRRSPLTIQDLGSTNGIKLSRGVLRGGDPVPIRPGESFTIGPFSFMVVAGAGAEPSSHRTGRDRLLI